MYENMIVIDRNSPESLQKQIRRQIAIGIVNRQYPLHHPLPSIRQLSADLGVSVTTVALAYEGLKQDGFVEGNLSVAEKISRRACSARDSWSFRSHVVCRSGSPSVKLNRRAKWPEIGRQSTAPWRTETM